MTRVLVVGSDRVIRTSIRDALRDAEIIEASDELTGGALADACRPDVIVLDATGADQRSFVGLIRRDFRTALTPVVHIVDTVPLDERVYGAADDYVIRPLTSDELSVRVRLAFHRGRQLCGVSPLTRLPGNTAVEGAIRDRQARAVPFACLYIDIDDFKSFNDEHGFARGDEVIRAVARCVVRALEQVSSDECFVAHVGGDDFIVLAPPEAAQDIAAEAVDTFSIEGCSISVGVVKQAHVFEDIAALGAAAAAAKAGAKTHVGSSMSVFSGAKSPV